MRRCAFLLLAVLLLAFQSAFAEENVKNIMNDIGAWISDTTDDVASWTASAATDAWNWTTSVADDAWHWASNTATGVWDGVTGFFDPPSTQGNPSIVPEPELPAGTNKIYLGYEVQKTGLDNGYVGNKEIGRDDPHFGLSIGKFYVSGFTSAMSMDQSDFIFLKTVGDNLELHFELTEDIDMLGGDTFVTINSDDGGYDKYFGISPTYFGRGTLIVRHTDYQNNPGTPQVYTDYLSGKMSGDANTIVSINEEGDYEIALDYEITESYYVLGTKVTNSRNTDYRIFFRFSVRNGNCMVFPFDASTGEELTNASATPNGFYLDLAYSRYLDVRVKRSLLVQQGSNYTEDVRFNRPASDGELYTQEGIYTITAANQYTGEQTVKTIYVGNDAQYIDYVSRGLSVEQILQALEQ